MAALGVRRVMRGSAGTKRQKSLVLLPSGLGPHKVWPLWACLRSDKAGAGPRRGEAWSLPACRARYGGSCPCQWPGAEQVKAALGVQRLIRRELVWNKRPPGRGGRGERGDVPPASTCVDHMAL